MNYGSFYSLPCNRRRGLNAPDVRVRSGTRMDLWLVQGATT